MTFLTKIVDKKKQDLLIAKQHVSLATLRAQQNTPIRDFINAIAKKNPAIIAEIKKASPSKGLITNTFDVAAIAANYEKLGAECLSVLTEPHFFQGCNEDLKIAKQHASLPVLRKDFIIDAYQIEESRALGADCILLIAALLDDIQLMDFCAQAQALGMAVLVESHDAHELQRALRLPTPLIGINNRNLSTFETTLETTINLLKNTPPDRYLISESGIQTREDITLLQQSGVKAFLIGETLMRNTRNIFPL